METLIDKTDARILDMIQSNFPLDSMPFDVIGQRLSIDPNEVLTRIKRMKSDGIIRQISAIFDSAALGYRSTLVAFKVSVEALDHIADEVSKHYGVSHCYSRDADYNLWFTLTLVDGISIHSEVSKLAESDGVLDHMLLPAIKVFKIGVILKMSGGQVTEIDEKKVYGESLIKDRQTTPHLGREGTPICKATVRALQNDLPLIERPFLGLANQAGTSEDNLIACACELLQNGTMRRYSAVLNHRTAGYTFNAMICWHISPDMIDEIGIKLSQHPSVSHCYERPVYPVWSYNLYTMVHARSQTELDKIILDLTKASTNADHLVLRTLAEYKKKRVQYLH